ncbi:MAG: DNA-binding protein [Clostridia bacterium]|nr:DNA-binding protein [Clostridia bacterium]
MSVEEEVYYNYLYEEYSQLLTENQRSVFEMYFGLDLSLGEIAEIKGVSRQSAFDSVSAVKKQLVSLEEKLGLYRKKIAVYRLIEGLSEENKQIGSEIKKILGDS